MKLLVKLYDKALQWAAHRYASRYLAVLSFAESSFFPVPPDVMLAPMALAKPLRAFWYAWVATISSVVGGVLGYSLGYFIFEPIMYPMIVHFGYEAVYQQALLWFEQWGFWTIFLVGFTPIPYKIFTITAGMLQFSLPLFIIASVIGRGLRFYLLCGIARFGGEKLADNIRLLVSRFGWIMGAVVVVLALIFVSGCAVQEPAKVSSLHIGKEIHIVRVGDTLYSIAWRNKIDYQDLALLNHIEPPYVIYLGQKIHLTGKLPVEPKLKLKPKPNDNPTPQQTKKNQWLWPTTGRVITHFSQTGLKSNGLALKNRVGTPICAAKSGRVVYSGHGLRGYGNLIILKHDEKYLSAYAHNRKNIVKEGEEVRQGQVIATMGKTGTNQVKLHFEIRYKGKPINPETLLPTLK